MVWPWSSGSDKPTGTQNEPSKSSTPQDATKKPAEFDASKLPQREKLPPKLQKIVEKSDKEENFFDELVEG